MQDKRKFLGVPPGPGFSIASDNELTNGLVGLFLNQAGRNYEYVTSAKASVQTATYKATQRGAAFAYSNTQSQFAHVASQELLGAMSVAVWLDINSLTNYGALISKGTGTGTNQPFELRIGSGPTDGKVELLRAGGSSFRSFTASAGNTVVAGANQFIAAVAGPEIQEVTSFFVNGATSSGIDTGNTGTGSPTGTSGPIYIGKRADGVTYLDGNILAIGLWKRKLSGQELQRLRQSPYQLLTPRRIWVPVSAGGGVVISATPGNAAADGVTAQINQARLISAGPGNAVADGVTAQIITTGAVVIDCTPGNAVADGVTAKVDQARLIAATPGNAVAAGVDALISTATDVVINATPGNAVAAGVTAGITANVLILATPGNAVAAGVDASVTNGDVAASRGGGFWMPSVQARKRKKNEEAETREDLEGAIADLLEEKFPAVVRQAPALARAAVQQAAQKVPVSAVRRAATTGLPTVVARVRKTIADKQRLIEQNNKFLMSLD